MTLTTPDGLVLTGLPAQTYKPGDRVTALFPTDAGDHTMRLVGDVTASDTWTFTVTWAEQRGVARFVHAHEPDTLRMATAQDERDALTNTVRATTANELTRIADRHPHWPPQVRHALRLRAAELIGHKR